MFITFFFMIPRDISNMKSYKTFLKFRLSPSSECDVRIVLPRMALTVLPRSFPQLPITPSQLRNSPKHPTKKPVKYRTPCAIPGLF